MNGLGKHLEKKLVQKNWKYSKHQSEIASFKQQTTSENAKFSFKHRFCTLL